MSNISSSAAAVQIRLSRGRWVAFCRCGCGGSCGAWDQPGLDRQIAQMTHACGARPGRVRPGSS